MTTIRSVAFNTNVQMGHRKGDDDNYGGLHCSVPVHIRFALPFLFSIRVQLRQQNGETMGIRLSIFGALTPPHGPGGAHNFTALSTLEQIVQE